jgi:hypothetical protein
MGSRGVVVDVSASCVAEACAMCALEGCPDVALGFALADASAMWIGGNLPPRQDDVDLDVVPGSFEDACAVTVRSVLACADTFCRAARACLLATIRARGSPGVRVGALAAGDSPPAARGTAFPCACWIDETPAAMPSSPPGSLRTTPAASDGDCMRSSASALLSRGEGSGTAAEVPPDSGRWGTVEAAAVVGLDSTATLPRYEGAANAAKAQIMVAVAPPRRRAARARVRDIGASSLRSGEATTGSGALDACGSPSVGVTRKPALRLLTTATGARARRRRTTAVATAVTAVDAIGCAAPGSLPASRVVAVTRVNGVIGVAPPRGVASRASVQPRANESARSLSRTRKPVMSISSWCGRTDGNSRSWHSRNR